MRGCHRPFGIIPKQGLTLVELLIAMAIVSIAMLGVVGMFPVAHQHIRAGGDLTKATGLAQRMVELLRDERFGAVARYHNADTRQTSSFPADDLGGDPPFRGGSWLQRWREEISPVPFRGGLYQGWGRIEVEPIDRGLLAIRVTVGWPAFPTERTVELATYLAQQ
jgi:prepilin-type N-terminal cleavage/methylation domain-containing protein